MKKLLAFTLALTVMFGCACSSAAKPSGDRPGPVSDADDTDVVVEDIHFDYPDQIVTKPGGTAGMTFIMELFDHHQPYHEIAERIEKITVHHV